MENIVQFPYMYLMLTDFLLGLYKRIFYTYKDNKIR